VASLGRALLPFTLKAFPSPDPWIFVEGFGGVFNDHETLKALSCGGSTKKNSSDIGFLYGYHHLQNHMF